MLSMMHLDLVSMITANTLLAGYETTSIVLALPGNSRHLPDHKG